MLTLNHDGSTCHRARRILSAVAMSALGVALPLMSPLAPAAMAGPLDRVSIAADVKVGPSGSDPTGLLDMGGTVYFAATQGDRELWKSDGSAAGTTLVRDISAGAGSSDPRELTRRSASTFYFSATGFGGRELWKSNGTASGTAQVGEVNAGSASSAPVELTMVGNTLFFSAFDGTDRELWKSDGTLAGTVQVKDIMPGAGSSDPQDLTQAGTTLYFSAVDGAGRELWKSDGTAAGTVRVKDINPGSDGSLPFKLAAVGGTLFFGALSTVDGVGNFELWKSDGTTAGTVRIRQTTPRLPDELTDVGGTLFFSGLSSANGKELWKSDGTAAGTVLVADIVPGDQSSVPAELTAVGGRLFFEAGPATNRELWTSDGTSGGTVRVKDIRAGASSDPGDLTDVAGTLYYSAADDANGRELWRSDGTAAGTAMVGDVSPGPAGSGPTYLTTSGGALFMSADDGAHGRELWHATDTTPPDTSITSGPAEGSTIADGPVTVGFGSDDIPSTFECRFSQTSTEEGGEVPAFGPCSTADSDTIDATWTADTLVTFEVRATDAAGNVDPTPASRTFTVTAADTPPVAVDDDITVVRDVGLPAALDVLANDTDADGGPIQIEAVTQPTSGSVQIVDSGSSLSYEPSPQYCNNSGPFTYTLNGGSTATVKVTVLCGDSPPIAVDDDISVVRESGPSSLDVLANDRNVDGGPIQIEAITQPRNGSVQIVDSGASLAYEPDRNFCTDGGTFTYTLNGGSTATVEVRVICHPDPVDQAPVAVDDAATVDEDAGATEIDVLANDTDPDGGPKLVESVTQPVDGTVEITGSGSGLSYAPNPGYCNEQESPDIFTYTLNRGSTATVEVVVTCADDPSPVDTTAPETEITTAPNLLTLSLWPSQGGTFAFTSTEQGSIFECRVDEGAFTSCASPHALTIPFGSHLFEVRSVDQAGNIDPTPAARRVLVLGLALK
jgi:ELWxxDGT repeat protein